MQSRPTVSNTTRRAGLQRPTRPPQSRTVSENHRTHRQVIVYCPSSAENNGILLDLHDNRGAMGYGIEAFTERNPLAWPSFATEKDVQGFPPTVISVNECDPLRDEGINFYRLLLRAGVPARCRQVMGTMHGTEIFTIACPEISRDTARDLAAFGKN